jgi:hypothetical protein
MGAATLSITTLSIITLSITTLSIITLSIITLSITMRKRDTQHNGSHSTLDTVMPSVIILSAIYAECR